MKLKELRMVLVQTELPIVLFTNRLRWGECQSEHEALEARFQLAEFVTIKADLKEHVFALEQILEICDAVAKGRYLEDRQRCHWNDHTCQHQCTAKDEHCDSFDERPPHQAILGWLDDCRPLRDVIKDWVVTQGEIQQKMRQGFREFFPEVKAYQIGEDTDGNQVMVEMTPEVQAAYDAREHRQHESVAARVEQYELNLRRIRHICAQRGDLQEVASLIQEGLPPTIRQPISSS